MDERSGRGRSLMFNKQSLKRRALKEEKLIKLYKVSFFPCLQRVGGSGGGGDNAHPALRRL